MTARRKATKREEVVVLGGGFAGLAALRSLPPRFRTTLVDERGAFEFLPNIHELISGLKTPDLLRLPLATLARRARARVAIGVGALPSAQPKIEPFFSFSDKLRRSRRREPNGDARHGRCLVRVAHVPAGRLRPDLPRVLPARVPARALHDAAP